MFLIPFNNKTCPEVEKDFLELVQVCTKNLSITIENTVALVKKRKKKLIILIDNKILKEIPEGNYLDKFILKKI